MKETLSRLARGAGEAVSSAANKTSDYLNAHRPSDEDLQKARTFALKAGNAVSQEAVALGKEVARSKTFKDAAKGAGVGAVVAVPVPLIGPAVGAVVGAAAGVFLGRRAQSTQPAQLPAPSVAVLDAATEPVNDIYTELNKLEELRQRGILTDDEFAVEKRKVLGRG